MGREADDVLVVEEVHVGESEGDGDREQDVVREFVGVSMETVNEVELGNESDKVPVFDLDELEDSVGFEMV